MKPYSGPWKTKIAVLTLSVSGRSKTFYLKSSFGIFGEIGADAWIKRGGSGKRGSY